MFTKTCECGKTQKNFKFDIGGPFRTTCCDEADAAKAKEIVVESKSTLVVEDKPEFSKKALKGMKVAELRGLAEERGIEGCSEMKKKDLIKVLVG